MIEMEKVEKTEREEEKRTGLFPAASESNWLHDSVQYVNAGLIKSYNEWMNLVWFFPES